MNFGRRYKVDHYHHKTFLFSVMFLQNWNMDNQKLRNEVEIDLFKSNKNAF